jgi:hypothetical protein
VHLYRRPSFPAAGFISKLAEKLWTYITFLSLQDNRKRGKKFNLRLAGKSGSALWLSNCRRDSEETQIEFYFMEPTLFLVPATNNSGTLGYGKTVAQEDISFVGLPQTTLVLLSNLDGRGFTAS